MNKVWGHDLVVRGARQKLGGRRCVLTVDSGRAAKQLRMVDCICTKRPSLAGGFFVDVFDESNGSGVPRCDFWRGSFSGGVQVQHESVLVRGRFLDRRRDKTKRDGDPRTPLQPRTLHHHFEYEQEDTRYSGWPNDVAQGTKGRSFRCSGEEGGTRWLNKSWRGSMYLEEEEADERRRLVGLEADGEGVDGRGLWEAATAAAAVTVEFGVGVEVGVGDEVEVGDVVVVVEGRRTG
ncbi:hypothetical protein B0T19DRAFT_124255 [Cercophora scortea]|uniref:Uncharacterized protein n=1 Tax=Cercophora scortea TaxID=314031 RepID=A0AAE0IYF7_9PEZI|nr:hypothetical protein B0T19DRAFT_124255 [Cercophora scortea]